MRGRDHHEERTEVTKMNELTQPAAVGNPKAGQQGTQSPFSNISPSPANLSDFALSMEHLQFSLFTKLFQSAQLYFSLRN